MWVLREESVKYYVCLLRVVRRDEDGVDAALRQIFGNVVDESLPSYLVRVGHLFGVSYQTYHGDILDVHSMCEQECSERAGLSWISSKIDCVVQIVYLSVYEGVRYAGLIQFGCEFSDGISKD